MTTPKLPILPKVVLNRFTARVASSSEDRRAGEWATIRAFVVPDDNPHLNEFMLTLRYAIEGGYGPNGFAAVATAIEFVGLLLWEWIDYAAPAVCKLPTISDTSMRTAVNEITAGAPTVSELAAYCRSHLLRLQSSQPVVSRVMSAAFEATLSETLTSTVLTNPKGAAVQILSLLVSLWRCLEIEMESSRPEPVSEE